MKKLLYILLFVPFISFAQVDGNPFFSSDSCEVLSNEVVNSVSSLQLALESWNPSIDLSQGWNMIGYGCPYGRDVEIAFIDHINDITIIKDNSGNVYIPSWNYNGIGNLLPGYGYQIKVAQDILDFRFCDWYVNNVPNDNINSLAYCNIIILLKHKNNITLNSNLNFIWHNWLYFITRYL